MNNESSFDILTQESNEDIYEEDFIDGDEECSITRITKI